AGEVFRAQLRQRGVRITGKLRVRRAPGQAVHVGKVSSPPLRQIVGFMNRHSDNYTAELLVKDLGRLRGGSGSTAAGLRVMRRELEELGAPMAEVTLADGSGLAGQNRTTARAVADLLNVVDRHATL